MWPGQGWGRGRLARHTTRDSSSHPQRRCSSTPVSHQPSAHPAQAVCCADGQPATGTGCTRAWGCHKRSRWAPGGDATDAVSEGSPGDHGRGPGRQNKNQGPQLPTAPHLADTGTLLAALQEPDCISAPLRAKRRRSR
jgi:hypothetical protein